MRVQWVCFVVSVALCSACTHAAARHPVMAQFPKPVPPAAKPVQTADQKIAYYEARLQKSPENYPILALVGRAYLEKGRLTHQPSWLAKARAAEQRSLAIQETFDALKAMVDIQNYTHHFEDALKWEDKAAAASVNGTVIMDPSVVNSMVESHMGLGQYDEARKLLPPDGVAPTAFYVAAARGNWYNAQKRPDEAVADYTLAAKLAEKQHVKQLVTWAWASAAGAFIDNHRPAEAKPYLAKAAALAPTSTIVLLHEAELARAFHQPAQSLALYEQLLAKDPNPELERQAFVVAKEAGDTAKAKLHFDACEKGLRTALDAGEVFPLGALAQLYVDAHVNLDRARQLSEENLKYKRDNAAEATYAALHSAHTPQAALPVKAVNATR